MRNKKNVAEVKCQRCNEMGHWTYQCTNPPAYNYRPSRTMQYKLTQINQQIQIREEQLRYKLNEDKGPKGPKITDGDKRRTVKIDKDSDLEQLVEKLIETQSSSSSVSSSSSSDSEIEQPIQRKKKESIEQVEKKKKELDKQEKTKQTKFKEDKIRKEASAHKKSYDSSKRKNSSQKEKSLKQKERKRSRSRENRKSSASKKK